MHAPHFGPEKERQQRRIEASAGVVPALGPPRGALHRQRSRRFDHNLNSVESETQLTHGGAWRREVPVGVGRVNGLHRYAGVVV